MQQKRATLDPTKATGALAPKVCGLLTRLEIHTVRQVLRNTSKTQDTVQRNKRKKTLGVRGAG